MEKKSLILVVAVLFLVAGGILVSAHFSDNEEIEDNEVKVQKSSQESCGPNNCNSQCGGKCGIPTCGCGR